MQCSYSPLQVAVPSTERTILLAKHLLKLKQNLAHLIVVTSQSVMMAYIVTVLAVIQSKSRELAFWVQTLNGLFLFALTKMALPMKRMKDTDQVVKSPFIK